MMRFRDRLRRWYIVKRIASPDEPMIHAKEPLSTKVITWPRLMVLGWHRASTGEWVCSSRVNGVRVQSYAVILVGVKVSDWKLLAGFCCYLGPWAVGLYWERSGAVETPESLADLQ